MSLAIDAIASALASHRTDPAASDPEVSSATSTTAAETSASVPTPASAAVVVQGAGLDPAYARGDGLARAASAADASGGADLTAAHADFLASLQARLAGAHASGAAGVRDAGSGDGVRLQALHLRQQLQALPADAAIANAAPQSILSLFRA